MIQEKYAFEVSVNTAYLADQSQPDQQQFAFAYTITITNIGQMAAQLISRHWIITDAHGDVREVEGLGVVGAQPLLAPKEQFEYTSGSVIATPVGTMHGRFFCVAVDGKQFTVDIAEFVLSVPRALH